MKHLAKIVLSSTPSTSVQFRRQAYGRAGVQSFLRDVLAMANASVEGPRYIVVGAEIDASGRRHLFAVDRKDFSGKPAYQALANEHIEPPIRIHYEPVTIDDECLGVFEIDNCQDRPYMMRTDYSETLRRGDAYIRINDLSIKMGRRQLQTLFDKKFRDSVSTASIEIGFPGDIIHKDRHVATCDLEMLPSAVASSKLKQLLEAKGKPNASRSSGWTSTVLRLTFARLFGSDSPYEEHTADELCAEMQQVEHRYHDHDNYFLFEENASELQLVVYSQGKEPIKDASLSFVLPNHDAFHVATQLPKELCDEVFTDRAPSEHAGYPAVSLSDDAIKITARLGDIPAGEPVSVFKVPLRICAGSALKGRRLGIQYLLFAQNLHAPAKGTLRLLFQGPQKRVVSNQVVHFSTRGAA